MSDIDTRPAPSRGRSSTRGGRGGFGRGGPRGGHRPANGSTNDVLEPSIEEQGELGELKKQYSSQLSLLKDMFPDWTDVDLVMALQETDGDIQTTIDRITEGHVTQFSEIKKPKDRARSKAKEQPAFSSADYSTSTVRGGRGRGGFESTRGGRGRGDRGRGGARGGRGGVLATNGAPRDINAASVPTTESAAWDSTPAAEPATSAWESAPVAKAETTNQGGWGDVITSEATPAAASEGAKSSLIPEGASKKTWASMFAQAKPAPAPAPVAPQQPVIPGPVPAELAEPSAPADPTPVTEEVFQPEPEPLAPPPAVEEPVEPEPQSNVPEVEEPKETADTALSHPQDPLTEDNLENLPDSSHPPATHTAASTVGSVDPRTVTPLLAPGQQAPIGRPPLGGYGTSAYRATGLAGRSASFQRRVLDQQEAVVMPGHNAVDRAAVQFGSMGLNGDSEGLDVDDEREEPETRTQPPQQSPPGQPRASLPPAPIQAPAPQQQDAGLPESLPTPKPAPGLPPVAQHQQHQQQPYGMQQESAQNSGAPQSLPQDSLSSQGYGQYARYGQSETAAPAQKSYDPFAHQTPSSSFDQYSSHLSQPAAQQQGYGGFSSAPSDYSQYYTADQQRNAYQNYYGASYGQQNQAQQDSGVSQQRSSSNIGAGSTESPYVSHPGAQQAQQSQQSQPRYADTQGSGQNTPQPLMGGQQHSTGPSQQMHQQQQQQQQQHHHQAQQQYNSAFPYGHPYYQSPYQTAYQNQFGYSGGYGGAQYGGQKGGMYGQPQGYGMNAPSSYDNTSSPAASGFGQQSSMQSREPGLSGGLGDYGRTSSTQPSGLGSGSFGSDPFARSQSGYQGQSQGYGQQQQSAPSEELKPFGDSKGTGPSPALGQPGRPGSAANSIGNQSQASLPPPQGHQQGFGGYPGFNQGSQYGGGLGGLGVHQGQGQQGQGQGGYGAYGGGFGNSYSQYGRGGWGGNYGH